MRAWDRIAVGVCTKNAYPDQVSARAALQTILKQAPVDSSKLPKRVYPCDICDGWHLTAKRNRGKKPPWDRDPNWTRPNGVAHLERRTYRKRARRRRDG